MINKKWKKGKAVSCTPLLTNYGIYCFIMARVRKIIHIDMDAFYASVEQRNNPRLRGKPVIVGGSPGRRGIVATCSYEARAYGIHSAMSSSEAYRRAPHAVFITKPNYSEYLKISRQVRSIFLEVTDLIEPLSFDEAYLDVSQNKRSESSATFIARWIRQEIFRRTRLTASAGVSFNKSMAKIASDWNKPNGLTVITPQNKDFFLDRLPISKFWGIGKVTSSKMVRLGVHNGAQLRKLPLWKLTELFGKAGYWYYNCCRGIDGRNVELTHERKSIGREQTLEKDTNNLEQLSELLKELCAETWKSMEKHGLLGQRVLIKVKYYDFKTASKTCSFPRPIEKLTDLMRIGVRLLGEFQIRNRPLRLVGISMSSLIGKNEKTKQLSLNLEQGS